MQATTLIVISESDLMRGECAVSLLLSSRWSVFNNFQQRRCLRMRQRLRALPEQEVSRKEILIAEVTSGDRKNLQDIHESLF